jgi:lysozyme family protein
VRFDDVFERVVGREGGYVNDPRDPGGETKFGISKRQYPDTDIKGLTLEKAKEIYLRDYWDKVRADDLPEPVDEFLFDFAVNSGVERAAQSLQGAVGALRDGAIGPKTIELAGKKPPLETLRLVFVDRAMVFALNPNDKLYGRGWFARLFDLTLRALTEIP